MSTTPTPVIAWSIVGPGVLNSPPFGTFYVGPSEAFSSTTTLDYESILKQAFADWAAVTNLQFIEVADSGAPFENGRDVIRIGDVSQFIGQDLPSSVIGLGNLGYYDIALADYLPSDANEFLSVATHEIGHNLGLSHSFNPADIMFASYQGVTVPSAGDKTAVDALHGAPTFAPPVYNMFADQPNLTILNDVPFLTINGTSADNVIHGGSGDETINGGLGNDTLAGNGGDDMLIGGGGADLLTGGPGDDTYIVDNTGVHIKELVDAGADTVQASVTFALSANIENLVLTGTHAINGTGNAMDNTITGNDATNVINGEGGADTMIGGHGNDSYYVDNAADQIVEGAGDTGDRVYVGADYTLQSDAQVEYVFVSSTAGVTVEGNDYSHHFYGNAGSDHLIGSNSGIDVLDGKGGADIMEGRGGNDYYYVDNGADQIIEGAGDTGDRVYTSVDYTLQADVQVESLHASSTTGVTLTGNSYSRYIYGNTGDDHLVAGPHQTLTGGGGNDTFVFNAVTDSPAQSGVYDIIQDFVSGQDKIDLSAIHPSNDPAGALTFIHGDAFSHTAGEVRAAPTADHSATLITADIDGDGRADLMISLRGAPTIQDGDLILHL